MGEESESDIEEKEKCNTRKKCRSEIEKHMQLPRKKTEQNFAII